MPGGPIRSTRPTAGVGRVRRAHSNPAHIRGRTTERVGRVPRTYSSADPAFSVHYNSGVNPVQVAGFTVGGGAPLAFIVGPCVIESAGHALERALAIRDAARRCDVPVVFKASFDKANRTSASSYRGPGLTDGLKVLADVKGHTGLPILTDIEGTTSSISFVKDVLFPYARRELPRFAPGSSRREQEREQHDQRATHG